VLLIAASLAEAQSATGSPPGFAEYLSLLGTPTASLPPLATYTLAGLAQQSPEVVARYGYVQDVTSPLAPSTGGHTSHSLGTFGLTGILPVGLGGTLSLTAGLSNERCDVCSGSSRFMGSAAGDYRILSTSINEANATRLTLGANAEIGLGFPTGARTFTGDVGIPVAFVVGDATKTQIIPFLTPSLAFVGTRRWSTNTWDVLAGRALLGGGVSLLNAKSALGASVGFQYVFVSKTQVQFGVGLSIGGR
jgi:hypothetical protein